MKYIVAIVLVLALLEPCLGLCHHDGGCRDGQCCVGMLLFGSCRSMSQQGRLCSTKPYGNYLHQSGCPCDTGLFCVASEETVGGFLGQFITTSRNRCSNSTEA